MVSTSTGDVQPEAAEDEGAGDDMEADEDEEQVVAVREEEVELAHLCESGSFEKAGDSEWTPEVEDEARDEEVVDSVADSGRCWALSEPLPHDSAGDCNCSLVPS